MKLELSVEGLTMSELLHKQKELLANGSNVEVSIDDNGKCILTWNVNNKNPLAVIDSIDNVSKLFSLDIMDNFECVDVESVKYSDADHLWGCGEYIHTLNEI